MNRSTQTTIRRLGPGDEDVIRALAENEPQTALLSDDRTVFVAAFDGETPVGYVLPIGRRLMEEVLFGRDEAFVLTEADNEAAMALYASLGGTRVDSVMWDF